MSWMTKHTKNLLSNMPIDGKASALNHNSFPVHQHPHSDIDPDAPGIPGTPGYEPKVKRSELDAKGKKIFDANKKSGTKSNKHASNLLKYNAVDDKSSALNYNGKKKYDEFGTEIPKGFTVDSTTGKAMGDAAGVTGTMRTVNTGYQTNRPTFDDGSNIPKKPGENIGGGGIVISSTGKGKKTIQKVRKLFTS